MASLPQSHSISYEEWLRLPESQGVEEVVNGEIRITPAPSLNHADVVQNTYDQIRPQVDKAKVAVYTSKFDLVIRRQPLTTREPDIAVCHRENMIEKDGRLHSPPELIVEVLSPANTRRESKDKLADYAGIAVPEVWIFSPEARTIEVLHLKEGQYQRAGIFADGVLTPLHFPNVQVRISEIWPD